MRELKVRNYDIGSNGVEDKQERIKYVSKMRLPKWAWSENNELSKMWRSILSERDKNNRHRIRMKGDCNINNPEDCLEGLFITACGVDEDGAIWIKEKNLLIEGFDEVASKPFRFVLDEHGFVLPDVIKDVIGLNDSNAPHGVLKVTVVIDGRAEVSLVPIPYKVLFPVSYEVVESYDDTELKIFRASWEALVANFIYNQLIEKTKNHDNYGGKPLII